MTDTVHTALARSAEELRRVVETHRKLLETVDGGACADVAGQTCASLDCSCRRRLRETLHETITVLEGTRKTFKSRQLAELKERLLQVLAETG
jgi:hypothetical protein